MSRTRRRAPRRPWYGPDKIRAAYMAGKGSSAAEIATAIGNTTGARVRAMLRVYDIPLLREHGDEDILLIRWKETDRRRLNGAADRLDRDPAELAALIVRAVLATRKSDLLATLINERDVV